MRYFFLTYAIIAVLVIGILGFRGQHFSKPPIQVFPDMDNQDKLKAQAPSVFFADRQGGRLPVAGTQPRGFNEEGEKTIGGIPEYEFGGQTGYYYTGQVGDYFGTGMPEELDLTVETAGELIRRGEERFGIYCAVCHGKAGNGQGMTSRYGVPGIANFHLAPFKSASYPDGRIFDVITHGKGQMGAYGPNIPVRDRWAIIAYVRTLQAAKEAAVKESAEAPKEQPDTQIAPGGEPASTAGDIDPGPAVPPVTEDTPPTQPGAPLPGDPLPVDPTEVQPPTDTQEDPTPNEAKPSEIKAAAK